MTTPPAVEPKTPALPPGMIDKETLLAACGDDGKLLAEMIQIFLDEALEFLARTEAAVRSGDPEQLRTSAHKLRGLVSSFSISAAQAAEALEQLGIERRAGEAVEKYQFLNQAVQALRTILPTLTIETLRAQI